MAKNNNQQAQSQKRPTAQKAKKINLSLEQKKKMVEIAKQLKEQDKFNTDPISELVADGDVENAV